MIDINIVEANDAMSALSKVMELVGKKEFPAVAEAFKAATTMVESTWKQFALGAPMPGTTKKIKVPTGQYARSIHHHMLTPFRSYVYSDSKYARSLEEGMPQMDLKEIIPFGPRHRIAKDGHHYAIVPFRHGTPKATQNPMPEKMYQRVREAIKQGEFKKSTVTGHWWDPRPSPLGGNLLIERSTYAWGSRLGRDTGVFGNLAGMVAFDVPSGKNETRTEYMTFRVITTKQPKSGKGRRGWDQSWIVPAREGLHITRKVVEMTTPIIQEMMGEALKKDLGV